MSKYPIHKCANCKRYNHEENRQLNKLFCMFKCDEYMQVLSRMAFEYNRAVSDSNFDNEKQYEHGNEALDMAMNALANDGRVDAIMNEVMKKISVPASSGDPILPKTVLDEMPHPGKPDDIEMIPKHSFTQRCFDPFSVCEFNAGEERRRRFQNDDK